MCNLRIWNHKSISSIAISSQFVCSELRSLDLWPCIVLYVMMPYWICRDCDTLISVYKWPHNQRARQTQKWIRTHTRTHTHVVRDLKFIVCSASNTLTLALLFRLNLSTRHQKKAKKNKIPKPTKRRDMTRNLWDTVRLGFFCLSVCLSVRWQRMRRVACRRPKNFAAETEMKLKWNRSSKINRKTKKENEALIPLQIKASVLWWLNG